MSQRDDDQHTADQYGYHMTVIDDTATRWRAGKIDTPIKRKLIADENQRYYGGPHKSQATGDDTTRSRFRYDLPGVLAAASGIPLDVMSAALAARRAGTVGYRNILDDGGSHDLARTVSDEGVQAYHDILATGFGRQERTS